MYIALHLKLTGNDYFNIFPKPQTYVQAAANKSGGFKLLYRILEIIHPQLGISKVGIHKMIESLWYIDEQFNIIYTFIARYKNYLLYEELRPEKRLYNKRELTMFILNALIIDKRFRMWLNYVEATIQAY